MAGNRYLNVRQERFCQEYIIDGNAARAARDAGYSPKTAAQQGAKNLKQDEIKRRIETVERQRSIRTQITADSVLTGIQDAVRDAEANGETASVLRGYELLGKNLKLFIDRTEITGADGDPLFNAKASDLSDDELAVQLAKHNAK